MRILSPIHTAVAAALVLLTCGILLGNTAAQTDAERRRQAFEEAMRKIEAAERAQEAERQHDADIADAARQAQEDLRKSIDAEAATAPADFSAADSARAAAQSFASEVADKVPATVRDKFAQPPAVAPAQPPVAAPKVAPAARVPPPTPPKDGDDTPKTAAPKPKDKAPKETLIDSAKVLFDGSGRFGEKYQVVIFEEDVQVTNPEFLMSSDKLVAFFKRGEPEAPKPGDGLEAFAEEPEEPGNQLERAVATGREVTVTKPMAGGEPQIAKARKATYFADRDEVMLEIWPQVQRGKNLVIAKSRDTVIILKGEEMTVKGPVRTRIVGKGTMDGAKPKPSVDGGTVEAEEKARPAPPKETVIDAERGAVFNRPSARTGEKEVFFDGNVSVADPGFDLFGDDLTAYLGPDEKTGETVMRTAVMRGNKVEVQQRSEGGERFGKARRVVFIPATGDVRLEQETEIYRAGEWIRGGEVVMLNKDSKDFHQEGGRSKMSFTPGVQPPG